MLEGFEKFFARCTYKCPRSGARQEGKRFVAMVLWLARRVLSLLATLVLASVVVFVVLDVLPGNAAQVMLGPDADPQAVQALAAQLGLNAPAWQRYMQWLGALLTGDLGLSHVYQSPVAALLAERMAVTLPLALLAMCMGTAMAVTAGMLAAAYHRRWVDGAVMGLAQLGTAVPSFWLAMLLVLLFAVGLQWLPAGGFAGWSAQGGGGWWAALRSLLLPALALAVAQAAVLARVTRAAALEVMGEDFIRTARAKGLSPAAVLLRHVLGNTLAAVLTVVGMQFAALLAGSIVVENVFYLPGLGRLMLQAIANRDVVVVQNCVMLLVAIVVVASAVVDVLHALIDPRLQRLHPMQRLRTAQATLPGAAA